MALSRREQLSKLQYKALIRAVLETRYSVEPDGTLDWISAEIEELMWDCKPSEVKTSRYGYAMYHFNGDVFQSLELVDAHDYIDLVDRAEVVSYQIERSKKRNGN